MIRINCIIAGSADRKPANNSGAHVHSLERPLGPVSLALCGTTLSDRSSHASKKCIFIADFYLDKV